MNKIFFNKCVVCLLGVSCLNTYSLMGEEGMSSQKNKMMQQMMTQEITENDLLNQMSDSDKVIYQKLSPEGKILILKMANASKMKHMKMMDKMDMKEMHK